ncbi:MAG: hypothetical protein Q8N77_03600 [Nanoarchaeota archaeon]|nr:hypothetical protein [Nanoarchaeota archaeon]
MENYEKRMKVYEKQIQEYETEMGVTFDPLRKYNLLRVHHMAEVGSIMPIEAIELLAEGYENLKRTAGYIKNLDSEKEMLRDGDYHSNLAKKLFKTAQKPSKKRNKSCR